MLFGFKLTVKCLMFLSSISILLKPGAKMIKNTCLTLVLVFPITTLRTSVGVVRCTTLSLLFIITIFFQFFILVRSLSFLTVFYRFFGTVY